MKGLFSVCILAAGVAPALALAVPTVDELYELVKQQQTEIRDLKAKQSETEQKVEATADAVELGGATGSKRLEWAEKTKIGGYGEHHYNNFNNGDDQIDAHRYVLFVGHEYSDKVRMFSEVEIEHGLAGDEQPGEVELEQAYIEWDFTDNHTLVAGQFLIPVGILNETHEPETFYGVERNQVEKNVIPTTWWESGVLLRGSIAPGIRYDFAVHSGLETEDANIRSGRQKSAKATANDFAYTGRLKYTAIPGLELAATVQFQEDISQGLTDEGVAATLLETHAVYNRGLFGVKALYAQWQVDGELAEDAGTNGQSGWYIEPSIKPLEYLGFFVRYSTWDETAGKVDLQDDEVIDVGVNFWLNEHVVFKVDYQDAQNSDNDSLNLGLGWSF